MNLYLFLAGFNQEIRKRSTIIRNNLCYLTENMQPSDALIKHLLSAKCLKNAQAMSITKKRYSSDKNMELLHVVRSLPLENHLVFLDYLHFTDQRNVADVIEKGGGNRYFK